MRPQHRCRAPAIGSSRAIRPGRGKCRCRHCTDAAAIYRASRRAKGKDEPRTARAVDTDEDRHISRDWFRLNIWNPALDRAGLTFRVRAHDLRHAHASWLLAGGADLQMVKDRLGHGSISTTEKYLHKGSGIASDERGLRSLPGQDGGKFPTAQQRRQRFDQELRSDNPA